MKVAVVGAAGMLGAVTVREWRDHGHDVMALTRSELDVTNPRDVKDTIGALAPEVLVNCTAYNRVDDAEDDPSTALAVNTWAVRSMARAASRAGAIFVHYSTDFVFDGVTDRPYTEDDAPNPQSAYGISKLMGEWFVLDAGRAGEAGRTRFEVRQDARQYVLRVESLFGGRGGTSTINRMLASFTQGRPVTAFTDRTVSPSYVVDVAWAARRLVETAAEAGLYHCVNSGHATWFELAERLRRLSGACPTALHPCLSSDVALRALRPQFAALSNNKLNAAGIPMPHWADALARHLGCV